MTPYPQRRSETLRRYFPHPLLDALCDRFNCFSDGQLSRAIGISPSQLSRIRHRKLTISANLLLHIHEMTEWPFPRIRELIAESEKPIRRERP